VRAVEVIKKIAEAKKLYLMEMGIVTSIFPHSEESNKDNYECNVKLKNRDLELRKGVHRMHMKFPNGIVSKALHNDLDGIIERNHYVINNQIRNKHDDI
jgi:hypothetical protein